MTFLKPDFRAKAEGHGFLPSLGSGKRPALLAALGLCLLAALFLREPADGQAPPTEYDVKAAFLLNFARFVEWPANAFPNADAPITFCILGEDPFGQAIDTIMEGQTVSSRKVKVRRISGVPPPTTCQVLFLDRRTENMEETLVRIGPRVLTVSEADQFLDDGGMIHFVIQSRRVRFDINARAANAAGLRLRSQFLGVARSVR